jgi:hypothetical protein
VLTELRKNFKRRNWSGWYFGKISEGKMEAVGASEKFQKDKTGRVGASEKFQKADRKQLMLWKNFRGLKWVGLSFSKFFKGKLESAPKKTEQIDVIRILFRTKENIEEANKIWIK